MLDLDLKRLRATQIVARHPDLLAAAQVAHPPDVYIQPRL